MAGVPGGWKLVTQDSLLTTLETDKTNPQVCDLFHEDAQGFRQTSQPWWKIKLFVWEPVLFGTWDGVFTTCMINIFGVVLFLRTGYLVGNTGVLLGMFLVSAVVLVALATVMSGIGISEHCGVGSGGIYSMISTVLGGRVGGTVGLLYVFGQCVAGAMYITGFSESVAALLGLQHQWLVRGMSAAVLLALLGINLAGVKWIVRLQLLLLAVLAVSTLDFVVGTFTHLDPEHGFVGYSAPLLGSNIMPDYSPGETFFTVFGVFFPAATGVMTGFNMSSDLQRPEHNIPVGTLAAVLTSWFLYLVFVFLFGAVCTREALRSDFLIAEKVSLVGFLFLLGLYVSSLASCMGGLYGAPRILQCIAQERVIPGLAFLANGKGPNKTPVAAICLTSVATLGFILIGGINVLAPIVTINFLLTYSFIDYSYFCVVMTLKLQESEKKDFVVRQRRSLKKRYRSLIRSAYQNYGGLEASEQVKGTLLEFNKDMERIFASELKVAPTQNATPRQNTVTYTSRKAAVMQTLMDSFALDMNSNMFSDAKEDKCSEEMSDICGEKEEPHDQRQGFTKDDPSFENQDGETDAKCREAIFQLDPVSDSSYAMFCNHIVALVGALSSVMIMFVIQWVYALANIVFALLLYFYIGKTNPGLPLGVAARFSLFSWLKSTLKSICRKDKFPKDEIILTPALSMGDLKTNQLTEENLDFASRHRHHVSSIINNEVAPLPHH
ncbi:solute carrier family 12 member 8 isoform 1-T1 [Synchiropus picturatus]